jgi:hypothetical protein
LEEVGLIDDEKDGFPRALLGFQKGLLDLAIDGALGEPRGEAEEAIDVIQQVGTTQSGKGSIVGFEKILIQGVYVAPQGESLSHPGVSGEKQDAAAPFDIIEPSHGFLEGLRFEDILGLEVLIKRESFETKPSEQVFHGRTSPL